MQKTFLQTSEKSPKLAKFSTFTVYKIQKKNLDYKKSVATKQKFVNRTSVTLRCDRIINTKMSILGQN